MPTLTRSASERLITELNPRSFISEAYRTLRTNIQFFSSEAPVNVILVTSPQPEDGKTMTVSNLAVTFAQDYKKVLVIDADIRKPSLHNYFYKTNECGLTDVLAGKALATDVINETHIPNLSLLPSGRMIPNEAELLSSAHMQKLLSMLKEEFDIVLIDSPPLLAFTDSSRIAAMSDGVVVVMRQGKVKREAAKKALSQLEYVNARVMGVVLNHLPRKKTKLHSYYESIK